MQILKKTIGVILLLTGLIAFLLPDISTIYFQMENDAAIAEFQELYQTEEKETEELDSDPSVLVPENEEEPEQTEEPDEEESSVPAYDDLYQRCVAYNQNIYDTKQEEMVDPWSVAAVPSELEIEDDIFGYLEIPAMDVEMALYVGATNRNMARGAAILAQTSMPIGGENTNCVIAGHRGYQGIPYFREIEKLTLGDYIYITNPWETLTYEVVEIKIIDPDASDQILIQEGRDLVTLLTCHPYRSHGKYRYVVYCERTYITEEETEEKVEGSEETITQTETNLSEVIIESDVEFVSSEPDILIETVLRVGGAIIILILLFLVLKPSKKGKLKRIHRKT